MNRIFLTTLASVALCYATTPQVIANPTTDTAHPSMHMHTEQTDRKHMEKISEEALKTFEDRYNKIKDAGVSLSADLKSEFDYYMDVVAAELKALKDTNNKHHKKHEGAVKRTLDAAESLVRKHIHQLDHAKKLEERKAKAEAKAEERKARAAERKAKAEARKAEREAAKAKKQAAKAEKAAVAEAEKKEKPIIQTHDNVMVKAQEAALDQAEKSGKLDHGRSEGGSTDAPGTEAEKPLGEGNK
jgi:colicin import membrane protein